MTRRVRATTTIAVCLVVSLGCATGNYPELPAVGSEEAPPTDVPFDYVIGPGDELDVFVWGYPDLSVTTAVRPDGRITTRLVEDLQASGRTPTELAREIESRYAEFVNAPVVTVSVPTSIGTAGQQIRVIDASGEARSVSYSNRMTLLDLVVAIGGLGEYASGNRTVLVRGEGAERETFRLRAGDLVRKADMSANVALLPGDVVIIPQSWF